MPNRQAQDPLAHPLTLTHKSHSPSLITLTLTHPLALTQYNIYSLPPHLYRLYPLTLTRLTQAQDFLTPRRAEHCVLNSTALSWASVHSCVQTSGPAMQTQSARASEEQCPGCPGAYARTHSLSHTHAHLLIHTLTHSLTQGPTIHIAGGWAGHHPDGTFVHQICTNYTGPTPPGCKTL